jgi:hypothetical protein
MYVSHAMFSSGKFPLFFTELVGADPVAKCGLRAQTKGAVTAKYEAWQDFVLSDSSSRSCAAIADQARREASARVIKATMVAMVASGYNDSIRRSNVN